MINNNQKIYSYIGLAMRAGKVVSGDDTTLKELKKGKVHLVIVADDASDNTKKLFKDKSTYRNINQICFSTKAELGLSIGKSPRAVLGIKDKSLSQKILELIEAKI